MLALSAMASADSSTVTRATEEDSFSLAPVADDLIACTTCHGVGLVGNRALNAPRLAGLPGWYVRDQLRAFRQGWRGRHPGDTYGVAMWPQAAQLDDAAVERAVDLVMSTPAPDPVPVTLITSADVGLDDAADVGDAARGAELYQACAACHGVDGEGNEALRSPPLAGREPWYLARQIDGFRRGVRGYDAQDTGGTSMRLASIGLPDEQAVYDTVAHIARLAVGAADGSAPTKQSTAEDTSMNKQSISSPRRLAATATLALAVGASASASAEVRRHKLPGSDFPIAQAVEVLPGTTLVYHSGTTPRPANPDAEQYSSEYWGDTEAQTLSVFGRLEESLAAKGLTFGDVIKMQVFLVAPDGEDMMDFQGMMRAYRLYFGTEDQPNLPARSALQVAGLAVPGMLVEIEVVLARP
ncbi:MAG: Rid family hydrolase [Chromatocurvus sp.]